jgi:hypothetical protein
MKREGLSFAQLSNEIEKIKELITQERRKRSTTSPKGPPPAIENGDAKNFWNFQNAIAKGPVIGFGILD